MATNNTNLVIDNLTLSRTAANSLQAQLSKIRNLSVDITQASLSRQAVSDIQAAFQKIRPEIKIQLDTKETQKQASKLGESISKILSASGILDPSKNVGKCKTSHFGSIFMQWIKYADYHRCSSGYGSFPVVLREPTRRETGQYGLNRRT